MPAIVNALLTDAIQEALGLPRDEIQTDIRDLALSVYNEKGRIIWDSHRWDNEKVDEFTSPAATAAGIITFAATVDVVRAIRSIETNSEGSARVWNEDELIAAAQGEAISGDRFQHLADDADGYRRIMVHPDNVGKTYKVLALKRWVDAIVDGAYSAVNPSATPLDYRVMRVAVDRAEPALRAYVKDALRIWKGEPPLNNGDQLLSVAVRRETFDADRERRTNPVAPNFDEIGEW
jgi:hypothetical protein